MRSSPVDNFRFLGLNQGWNIDGTVLASQNIYPGVVWWSIDVVVAFIIFPALDRAIQCCVNQNVKNAQGRQLIVGSSSGAWTHVWLIRRHGLASASCQRRRRNQQVFMNKGIALEAAVYYIETHEYPFGSSPSTELSIRVIGAVYLAGVEAREYIDLNLLRDIVPYGSGTFPGYAPIRVLLKNDPQGRTREGYIYQERREVLSTAIESWDKVTLRSPILSATERCTARWKRRIQSSQDGVGRFNLTSTRIPPSLGAGCIDYTELRDRPFSQKRQESDPRSESKRSEGTTILGRSIPLLSTTVRNGGSEILNRRRETARTQLVQMHRHGIGYRGQRTPEEKIDDMPQMEGTKIVKGVPNSPIREKARTETDQPSYIDREHISGFEGLEQETAPPELRESEERDSYVIYLEGFVLAFRPSNSRFPSPDSFAIFLSFSLPLIVDSCIFCHMT
ncbi:hypothetical protein DFH07DRAFT_1020976 [Mycena maculata]|uniref:Uncharacterized protein n=1 Tax=Mycena maculata TaxID=230809 RepID=A0AAD7JB87_9AGAR|nr:hypothetical protein DFH07DRAFT_1020976 [Mycena maculata]